LLFSFFIWLFFCRTRVRKETFTDLWNSHQDNITIKIIYIFRKRLKNGAFGAKNHPSRRINFSFLIWPD